MRETGSAPVRGETAGNNLDGNSQYGAGKAHIVKIDVYVFGGTC